ncbi:MAG: 16S rRNA (guanine(527)-N(7))-methyltransferase RsmG [Pseudomonadota bacterium]
MRPESAEALAEAVGVSRETAARWQIHHDLLLRWAPKLNLVAASTLAAVWTRHFADSAQLWAHGGGRHWLDLGSGAGFPGLVLAAMAPPGTHVTLIEADARKTVFLNTVIREAALPAEVHRSRIEALAPRDADTITARAVAPLDRLLALAHPHLAAEGQCLFPKGARAESELTAAARGWHYRLDRLPDRVDPAGIILRLSEIARA